MRGLWSFLGVLFTQSGHFGPHLRQGSVAPGREICGIVLGLLVFSP